MADINQNLVNYNGLFYQIFYILFSQSLSQINNNYTMFMLKIPFQKYMEKQIKDRKQKIKEEKKMKQEAVNVRRKKLEVSNTDITLI